MRTFALSGHIGPSVSALVDGQLSAADEERVWSHVLVCPGCRRLVEREGWTKSRLRGLSVGDASQAPSELVGSLYDLDAWSAVARIEQESRRRRTAVALVGAGSVGAAVLGIVAATTPPAGRDEIPGPSPAVIRSGTTDLGNGGASARPRRQRPSGSSAAGSAGRLGAPTHGTIDQLVVARAAR